MQFVCDAAGQKTWFRIETEAEAARESLAYAPRRREVLSASVRSGFAGLQTSTGALH